MNAAPHESRSKVSPMQCLTHKQGECPLRLGLNSGGGLDPKRKVLSVVRVQQECADGTSRRSPPPNTSVGDAKTSRVTRANKKG